MIRRDYLIRSIEALGEELLRIESLQKEKRWDEADEALDDQIKRLTGRDAQAAVELSETELLALLIEGESTPIVREKAMLLTRFLKQAGDGALAQDHADEANAYYVKALRLLLKALHGEDPHDFPEFVPRIEELVEAVSSASISVETQALLMEHYETTGQFGKAHEVLLSIVAADPMNKDVLDFGTEFYERISRQSDDRLVLGELPRSKVEASLADLRARKG